MGWGGRAMRALGAVVLVGAGAGLVSPGAAPAPEVAPFGTAASELAPMPRAPSTLAEPRPSRPGRPAARAVDLRPQPARSSLEAFGVYIGGRDLATVEAYEAAIGLGRDEALRYVMRYASKESWNAWRATVRDLLELVEGPDQPRTLVLALPMLVAGPGPDGNAGTLAAGAAGAYDEHWRWLGRELARRLGDDLPDAVLLRPGWEANGHWFRWGYGIAGGGFDAARAGDFARYWRRLHDAVMGEVRAAGTDVQWVLNAAGSSYTSGGFEAAWPGDDAVDIVSLDLFQNEAFASTTDFSAAGGALQWLEAVGVARGKLIAVDETSVSFRVRNARQVGGQDNDLWFRSLRAWSDRVVDDGQLHHVLAFEADPSPTDLFAPVFPRHPAVSTFPEARQDLIDSFGGPRPPEP